MMTKKSEILATFNANKLASQNFTFLLYFSLLCSIRMVLYMQYYKTKAAYVSRWLPEMDMDRMGSVKLVSKSRNNFPFLVQPRTSRPEAVNILSFMVPEKKQIFTTQKYLQEKLIFFCLLPCLKRKIEKIFHKSFI